MQNHYNLLYREEEREMLPLCRCEGIGVIPWSPLARGLLAGRSGTVRSKTDDYAKRLYGAEESDQKVIAQVRTVAESRRVQPAQIALAWLLHKHGIIAPIVGVSKPPHLNDALGALQIKLSPEELTSLEALYVPHTIAGHD